MEEFGKLGISFVYVRKITLKNNYIKIKNSTTVEVVVNRFFSSAAIEQFILSKKQWIISKIEQMQKIQLQQQIPTLFGASLLDIYPQKELEELYKQELSWYIQVIIDDIAKKMSVEYASIRIKKYRRIWGSCDRSNNLAFNLLLCRFSKAIIRYVVVHELAHIRFKNHKKQFWDYVQKYEPQYKILRKQLKDYAVLIE